MNPWEKSDWLKWSILVNVKLNSCTQKIMSAGRTVHVYSEKQLKDIKILLTL